jgi:hypothetical protein
MRPVAHGVGYLALLLGFSFGAAGCVETMPFLVTHHMAPAVPVCQVVAAWCPEVVSTPDPSKGGAPVRGLAGRVYLFGQEVGAPLAGDGTLVVSLFEESAAHAKTDAALPLEEWRFDKETLKRLQRQDAVGWGYTVFLPWGTYRPEMTQVRLRLRYEPPGGSPLYNDSGVLVLRRSPYSSSEHTDIPALGRPGAISAAHVPEGSKSSSATAAPVSPPSR